MRLNLSHENSYLTTVSTLVHHRGRDARGGLVVSATPSIYYPGGGGQGADIGDIGGAKITSTMTLEGGETGYILESDVQEGRMSMSIDWTYRFDKMQQHTSQHLISHYCERMFGAKTLSYHMAKGDIAFSADLTIEDVEALESAVNQIIRESRDIFAKAVDGHREILIEGLGETACGGTHVRCTSEVQIVSLDLTKPREVVFLAGTRALQSIRRGKARERQLNPLLGSSPDGYIDAIRQLKDSLTEAKGALQRAQEEAAECAAIVISSLPALHVCCDLHGADGVMLRILANTLKRIAPEQPRLLLAGSQDYTFWACTVPVSYFAAVSSLVKTIGAGGGRDGVFSGAAPREKIAQIETVIRDQFEQVDCVFCGGA